MASLIDTKHEAFAQYVASGLSQTEAAKRAGFAQSSAHNTGSRLTRRPEIHQRIEELVDVQKNSEVPRLRWIIDQAKEIQNAAMVAADYSAANRALELIARVSGHLNERKESPSRVVNLNLLDTGQILQVLRAQWSEFTADDREELLLASPELSEVFDTDAIEAVQQANGVYGKPVDADLCNTELKGKKAEPE